MYILQLLLNVITTRIEALVVLGNPFLHVCVKEVCRLWAQPYFDTFHHLITVEALWSQSVLQLAKWVVVAWSKIRAVRRAVKELSVEILCGNLPQCQTDGLNSFNASATQTVLLHINQQTILTPDEIKSKSKSKSKSHCDWRSVSLSVLVSSPVWGAWPDIC
jgi:hypothetical protein